MPQLSFPTGLMRGVPVVSAPDRLDSGNAHLLQAAVSHWAAYGYATLVVDMTTTRLCNPAAFKVLLRAHRRAQAEGGELRIVLPPTMRFLSLTSHDGLMPQFSCVADAGAAAPAEATEPSWTLTA